MWLVDCCQFQPLLWYDLLRMHYENIVLLKCWWFPCFNSFEKVHAPLCVGITSFLFKSIFKPIIQTLKQDSFLFNAWKVDIYEIQCFHWKALSAFILSIRYNDAVLCLTYTLVHMMSVRKEKWIKDWFCSLTGHRNNMCLSVSRTLMHPYPVRWQDLLINTAPHVVGRLVKQCYCLWHYQLVLIVSDFNYQGVNEIKTWDSPSVCVHIPCLDN